MQVTCGAEWYTASDNKREYAISFDIADLIERMGEDKVSALSFAEKIKELNKLADAYVVAYVAKEGGMPPEFARKRLEEIANA